LGLSYHKRQYFSIRPKAPIRGLLVLCSISRVLFRQLAEGNHLSAINIAIDLSVRQTHDDEYIEP